MYLIIGIFILTLLLYLHFSTKRRLNVLSQIPGPKGIPIFGNFFTFVNTNIEELLDITSNLSIKYGGSYKIYAFNRILIVATEPNDIQDILSSTKHIEKNYLYDLLRSWLGEGLLLSGGLKWHNRRKIITPTFHFKILENFLYIFDQQSEILIEKLQEYCTNDDDEDDVKTFDIHNPIALATLDVIAETAMGIKINAQNDSNCDYVNAILEITDVIANRFIKMWLRNDLLCCIFANSMWKRQQKALKILHNFTEQIIVERRDLLIKRNDQLNIEESGKIDEFGQKKRLAFLDVLLQSNINGKPLSNADIREEVDTFMFEGHDTTTSAICFTLFLLSRHSDVQQKVFTEIVQVIGGNVTKKPVTYQNLQDLKYLELIIKESLRMYPPVALIGRKIEEATVINSKPIPANTQFLIYLQGLMRNPKVFSQPDKFIPERHSNGVTKNNTNEFNPYAYIPFSAGPRNCIGQKFAMLEMKSIISKILRNFVLIPSGPDVKPLMDIILRSKTGFHLGIKRRKF